MKKGIIFDLDGVLVFTDEYYYLAWKVIFDKKGLRFDRKMNKLLRGVSRKESLEIVLRENKVSLPEAEKQLILKEKNDLYVSYLEEKLNPECVSADVRLTLEELRKRGEKLAVGSSSKNARLIIGKVGLEGYFDAICDGNMITNSKPDPEVFLKAAEMIGLKPGECYVVEDGEVGIEAAIQGGFSPLGIGDALTDDYPHGHLSRLSDLLSLI